MYDIRVHPYLLVMIVPADIDREEWEPDAVFEPVEGNRVKITQRVRRSGMQLVGKTYAFQESFAEVLGDDRFISLTVAE